MTEPKLTYRPTASDVAKAAGTSRSAVSRAFRSGSPLSDQLRFRILAAARQLGYKAPYARVLAGNENQTITLVCGDLENPFYPVVVNGFSQSIHMQGHRMVLHVTPPDVDMDSVIGQVLDFRSDAAILASARMSSQLVYACRRQQMPMVLFNRVQPDSNLTAVTCDNYGGGQLVAEHFLAAGRKRIALLEGRLDTSTHLERARGFRDRLSSASITLAECRRGNFDYITSYRAVSAMLTGGTAPDALFCINDIMAIAALDAARTLGVRVPHDLAVIGFDDIPMASWPSYQLSSVRQPVPKMISETLDLVDTLIRDPAAAGQIRILPVSLIQRQTG